MSQLEQWKREERTTAAKWGISVEDANKILRSLPYSDIPDWSDLDAVLAVAEPILRAKIAAEIDAQPTFNCSPDYTDGLVVAALIAAGDQP